jgi:hypothetical protein
MGITQHVMGKHHTAIKTKTKVTRNVVKSGEKYKKINNFQDMDKQWTTVLHKRHSRRCIRVDKTTQVHAFRFLNTVMQACDS